MLFKLRPWISVPVAALLISQSIGCRSTGGPASWYGRACRACAIDKSCDCKDPFVEDRPATITEPATGGDAPEPTTGERPRRALFGNWPKSDAARPESHEAAVPPEPSRPPVGRLNEGLKPGNALVVPDSAIVPAEPSPQSLPDPVEPDETEKEPPKPRKTLTSPMAPPPPADEPEESATLQRQLELRKNADAEPETSPAATGEESGAAHHRPVRVDEIEEYPYQPGRGPVTFNDSRDTRNDLPQYPHAPGAGGASLRGIEQPTTDANVEPTRYAEHRSTPQERTGKIQSLFDLPTIQPGHTARSGPSTHLRSRY